MKPQPKAKPLIYTTVKRDLPKGHRYANARYFDSIKEDAPKVFVVGNFPNIVEAYRRVGIPVEIVSTLAEALADGPVAKPAEQGMTVGKGPGGRWYIKKGRELITGPFSTEDEAKAALAGQTGDIGTDSGEQFSDDQLRAAIEAATGEAPAADVSRDDLVAKFNELNAKAAE